MEANSDNTEYKCKKVGGDADEELIHTLKAEKLSFVINVVVKCGSDNFAKFDLEINTKISEALSELTMASFGQGGYLLFSGK